MLYLVYIRKKKKWKLRQRKSQSGCDVCFTKEVNIWIVMVNADQNEKIKCKQKSDVEPIIYSRMSKSLG